MVTTLWCNADMHDSARRALRVADLSSGYHHGDVHIFKHEITNAPLIDNVKPELKLI